MAGGQSATVIGRLRAELEGELGRRIVHAGGAVIPLSYVAGVVPWIAIQAGLVAGVALAAVLEYVRLRIGLDWWIFRHLTREYEQETVAGYALYVVGMAVAAWAFDPRVAVPAMLMLSLADPISGVLSSNRPRRIKRPRAIAGAFLACLALAVPFLPPAAAVGAAVAATAVDVVFIEVRGYVVDDNLAIPIAASAAAWAVLRVGPVV